MTTTVKTARTILLAAGLAIVLAPTATFAKSGDGPRGSRMDFETLDTNGDGQVTQAEMKAHRTAQFAKQDTDGDGFVTKEELTAFATNRRASKFDRMFERRDANADGKLSADEMAPSAEHTEHMVDMFERLDADNSGGVSQEEFETAMKKFKHRHKRKSN